MNLYEGSGWRLQRDPSRFKFSFLLGGEDWNIELSEDEWDCLCKVVFKLLDQFQELKDQLMIEEQISLEMEKDQWWASIDGNKENWCLRLIFTGDGNFHRSFELGWPVKTAQAVTSAMRIMWDSLQ